MSYSVLCSPFDVFLIKVDFNGSTTSYANKVMRGLRYRLFRDKDVILEEGVDYADKSTGGFDLLTFIMADDTTIAIQFY